MYRSLNSGDLSTQDWQSVHFQLTFIHADRWVFRLIRFWGHLISMCISGQKVGHNTLIIHFFNSCLPSIPSPFLNVTATTLHWALSPFFYPPPLRDSFQFHPEPSAVSSSSTLCLVSLNWFFLWSRYHPFTWITDKTIDILNGEGIQWYIHLISHLPYRTRVIYHHANVLFPVMGILCHSLFLKDSLT